MSIGRTLLIAFLGISLSTATLMTGLAYSLSRSSLHAEIRRNLSGRAATLMQQVDALLFERLENLAGWSRTELMQEVKVGDVDKRLAHFLSEIKVSYGDLYAELFCTQDDRIIAASTPMLIGQPWRRPEPWLQAMLAREPVEIGAFANNGATGARALPILVRLTDGYSGRAIGTLQAMVNWSAITRILGHGGEAGDENSGTLAILLDKDRRVIAASSGLLAAGLPLDTELLDWPAPAGRGARLWKADRIGLGPLLVAYANSEGYQGFKGFGWQLLVIEPLAIAHAPVLHLLLTLLVLLLLIMLLAAVTAFFTARRLARPIQMLTAFTRQFDLQVRLPLPPGLSQASGEVGELSVAFHELLTRLRFSQDRLVHAAKLAVVGEMAAAMAHEVRTPLGVLRSAGQMLERQPQLSAESKELIGFILSETERLNRLIGALLDCARPRPPDFRPGNLHEIAGRAVELLRSQAQHKHIEIEVELEAQDPIMECDSQQILQVFLNLLLNAIQMVSEHGRIQLRIDETGDRLRAEVCDDGPGVPPELRDKLFEPFVTFRDNGIGLGLTVVQQFVRLHGGQVRISDDARSGACFSFDLPRRQGREVHL